MKTELNRTERERYSRQLILAEVGIEGQLKLKNASVLVIGAGGLGCPLLQYLAGTGIGKIGIVDGDVVNRSNLARQILFSENDIGKNKAIVAKEKLLQLNPEISIEAFSEFVNAENAMEFFQPYDIIVDGSDNFASRYLVNDVCVKQNKPFVSGSVFQFEGQTGVFNYKNSGTYRCLFPEPPLPQERPDCTEIGVLGIVPGTIGLLMANEVIKLITGIGEPLVDRLQLFDFKKAQFNELYFERDEESVKKIIGKPLASSDEYEVFCSGIKAGMPVKEISAEELQNWMEQKKDFQLIDVREPYEHHEFNIGGLLIPMNDVMQHLHELEGTKPVVVYCAAGVRSHMVIKRIQEKTGQRNLYNLIGGITNYSQFFYMQDWVTKKSGPVSGATSA